MSPPDGAEAVRQIVRMAAEEALEPPRPLARELPPADPFPVEALGPILRPAAEAIHDKVQAPVAIGAQSVLGAAALAVQGHADIELPTGHAKPISDFFVTIAESASARMHAIPRPYGQSDTAKGLCARGTTPSFRAIKTTKLRGKGHASRQ